MKYSHHCNNKGIVTIKETLENYVTVQGVIKKMSYMELDGITMNKQL
jgi:hypothetical protein